jgi:putative heme-binding domain-containing protein
MNVTLRGAVPAFVYVIIALTAAGQEVIPHRQDRLPNRPFSPDEAVEAMTVPAGFSVEVVASEPEIVNPIAMAFDDRGRIWITESLEYPRKSPGPGRDRIKVLEDCDGDGRADRFTVFADGLNIPTGIAIGHGGVWVLNAPDLLFIQDRDGDGKGDHREVVVTGFGRADTHELPSTLTWGPDGWLYGLNGVFNPSLVRCGDREFRFTCAMWRVQPRTREFRVVCEGTSNPYGLAWEPEGSAIVEACHWANDHLFHFVETGYYKRQAGSYPPFVVRTGSITDHGHQKTAYCGLAYFDSDAYPPEYRDRLYTGNIHGGCINVDRLVHDGSTFVARGEPDFLTANDAWFMPVAQKVGPDGCLYILDWYDRYHCYQDANRDSDGVDRLKGRLYRVRFRDTPRARSFDLARESADELIARLASPNIYYRETAQRLLAERQTPAVRKRLKALVLNAASPRKARLHGLWALAGNGPLETDVLAFLLGHADPAYRAWGVRIAGAQSQVSSTIHDAVTRLARDASRAVQLQVAIAARKVEGLDALSVLVDVVSNCGEDRLIPALVWNNLHALLPAQGDRFVRRIETIDLRAAPALAKLLPRAVDRILAEPESDLKPVEWIIARLAAQDAGLAMECLSAVSDRMGEFNPTRRQQLQIQMRGVIDRLLTASPDSSLGFSARLLAARLGIGSFDAAAVRSRFIAGDQPEDIRLAALAALIAAQDPGLPKAVDRVCGTGPTAFLARVLAVLGRSRDPKVGRVVLSRYAAMAPELKPLAVDLLLQREPWARRLLDAVIAKEFPRSTLDANHLRRILESNDREAVWAVEREYGSVREERNPRREKIVAEIGQYLREHLGDPWSGQSVFKKQCAICHTIHGEGQMLGPDLSSSGRATFDQLLTSVFDPSLVIGAAYQTTTVVTEDGRSLTGLVAEDSERRIVLAMPGGGKEAIARINVKYTRTSKLSMMPEGIESILDRKELADLFAFLALDRPPGDPRTRPIPGAPQVNADSSARR